MFKKAFGLAASASAAAAIATGVWAQTGDPPKGKSIEELGRVVFQTSCTPQAQAQFERALAMLHSFFYPETVKAFYGSRRRPIRTAPSPIGGSPSASGPTRWSARSTPRRSSAASRRSRRARRSAPRPSASATGSRRSKSSTRTTTRSTRTRARKNYEKAMEALAKKYPDDVEAKIFYALALNETFDHKSMEPLVKAGRDPRAARQEVSRPSWHHALPHPQLRLPADRASAACRRPTSTPRSRRRRRTRSTCPRTSTRWSACGRTRSLQPGARSQVANEYAAKNKLDGVLAGVPHAYDFMEYAYLQLGQDAKAKALIEENADDQEGRSGRSLGRATRRVPRCRRATCSSGRTGRGRRSCSRSASPFPPAEAITHFARAMGAARSGDVAAAQADVAKLKEMRAGAGEGEPELLGRAGRDAGPRRPGLDRAGARASRRKRSSSCALPPISRTAARSTSRWRTASIRCASCWATC